LLQKGKPPDLGKGENGWFQFGKIGTLSPEKRGKREPPIEEKRKRKSGWGGGQKGRGSRRNLRPLQVYERKKEEGTSFVARKEG